MASSGCLNSHERDHQPGLTLVGQNVQIRNGDRLDLNSA